MRIALASEGTRGDVQPMLVLGESLAAAGHEVAVFGPPDCASLSRGRSLRYRPVGVSLREVLTREATSLLRGPVSFFRVARRYMSDSLQQQFELAEVMGGFDLLIGAALHLAGPSLAERHGIPYRYVAYTPALLESGAHPAPGIVRQTLPAWVNRASWRLFKGLHSSFIGPRLGRLRAELGLGPVPDLYRHLVTETPWVAADPTLAPVPEDAAFQARVLGFLFEARGAPLPEKLESFLAAGPPPVYLGFGSMPDPTPGRTTRELVLATERVGCRALLSRGWAGLGEGPLAEHVFATGSVCHRRLFPRVAAVVHHGGAGTTSAAARAGVPQIVIPHAADQFYWAHRVRVAGVSPGAIPRTKLRAERLAALLRETLGNEWLAERAREVGARLRAGEARAERARLEMLPRAAGLPSREDRRR